jgi:NodT family efflux transporter outer membrane factor (OMF) lipoprotein
MISVQQRHPAKPTRYCHLYGRRSGGSLITFLLDCCLLLFAGCAVGPKFQHPQPPAVKGYTHEKEPSRTVEADGQSQRFAPGTAVAGDWWRTYRCPQLDAVVQEAIAGSPNFQAAQERLIQSREDLRAGYGVFFPQVEASADATRQKFSPIRFGSRFGSIVGSTVFSLFTASISVNYVLDVFGGQRRTVEGLKAQMDYERYTALAAYLTLLSNVVNSVIAQAAYEAEIRATEEIIAFEKEQIRLTEVQWQAGLIPYSSVTSIKAQLAAEQATLPPLEQNRDRTRHLLAALVGRTSAEWAPPAVNFADITLPPELPISLPSDLVRQRPDILAAEAQLHTASANIGVATAALFPSFTLNGTYGQNSTRISTLFADAGNYWSYGGGVAAPAFQGFNLWFQRSAAVKAYQASQSDYRQMLVSAFQQVADSLRALEHDAETLRAQTDALAATEQTLHSMKTNYEAGLVNYLQVLTADTQYQQAKLGYIQARALRLQDTAALFVAMGGGWWNANLKLEGK